MNVKDNIIELQAVLDGMLGLAPQIQGLAHAMGDCLREGKKIITCGNGGSAADALHMAEELVGRYDRPRVSLPAVSLCADVTTLTCILNDYGPDRIFSRQLEALGNKGDMLFAFTTSGNSQNIIEAILEAKKRGVKTVLFSGKGGGKSKGLCDYELIVPSSTTARIQEVHTLILHTLLEYIDDKFCEV